MKITESQKSFEDGVRIIANELSATLRRIGLNPADALKAQVSVESLFNAVRMSYHRGVIEGNNKLNEIAEAVKSTNEDACTNIGEHAACLDRCLDQIEGILR